MNEGKECLGFSILREVFHVPPTVKNKLLSAWSLQLFSSEGEPRFKSPSRLPGQPCTYSNLQTLRDQDPHRTHRKFLSASAPTSAPSPKFSQQPWPFQLGPGRSLELPRSTTVYALCVFILGLSLFIIIMAIFNFLILSLEMMPRENSLTLIKWLGLWRTRTSH